MKLSTLMRRIISVATLFVLALLVADQSRADLGEHLIFRALHDGREGEHIFFLRDLSFWRIAVDHHRTQIGTTLLFDQPRTVLLGHIGHARLFQIGFDHCPNGFAHAGNRERGKASIRVGLILPPPIDRVDSILIDGE